ncbi:DUF1189 domain-containing protein [Bacillus sp. AK128]
MVKTKQSFFRKFKHAVMKPNEYPSMVQEGVKRSILYLLLLALTLGVISGVYHAVSAAVSYNSFLGNLEENVPYFALENGELTVEGDEPIIFEEDGASEIFIIDDTGEYTADNVESLLEEYSMVVLVTKDSFIMVDGFETTEFPFSDLADIYVDKDMILNFLPYLSWVLVLVGFGIVFWFFVSKLIMGFLYALFGLIASKVMKKRYSYGQLYSMGLYGITVPTIIAIILSMLGYSLPWIVYVAILMVYYVLALRSTPDQVEETTVDDSDW